jgi:hypothetical protein
MDFIIATRKEKRKKKEKKSEIACRKKRHQFFKEPQARRNGLVSNLLHIRERS